MTKEWGDRITLTDVAERSPLFEEALRQTRDRMAADMLGIRYEVQTWTWRDRLELAWTVLRGRITWSDIN